MVAARSSNPRAVIARKAPFGSTRCPPIANGRRSECRPRLGRIADFSTAFAGMDRTILLWRGNGVTLHSPAWPDHSLIRPLEPFPFRGEDDVHCELVNGPAADLNLMVHRDRAEGVVYAGESKLVVPAAGWDDGIVLAAGGAVCVVLPDRSTLTVEAEHMIRVSRADGPLTVVPETTKSRFVCIAVRLQ